MKISCQNCIYDRDCYQYKRNRKSECIDREYHYWEYYAYKRPTYHESSPIPPDFILEEEMEV